MGDGRVDRGEQLHEFVAGGGERLGGFLFIVDGLCVIDLIGAVRRLPSPPPQRLKSGGGERPARLLLRDSPSRAQDRVGADEFVGWRAHVHVGVVEDEVFHLDELAFEPQRGDGVEKMRARDPAAADRAGAQSSSRRATASSAAARGRARRRPKGTVLEGRMGLSFRSPPFVPDLWI